MAVKGLWGRMNKKARIAIIAGVCIALIAIGTIFFRADKPGVHLAPGELWSIGSFAITNTMISAWLTVIVVAILCYFATRRMKLVPTGLQNVMEALLETIIKFIDGIAGEAKGRKFFPVVATIFLFVLANAWLALLPGFMAIGIYHGDELVPIFRPANTDVNLPLALAFVSFVFVEYWGIRYQGFFRYMRKFINVGKLVSAFGSLVRGRVKQGLSLLFAGVIDVFIGIVEFVSELIRILSFTFRLFGNMTAGEILLGSMIFLIPWMVAIPFYGLELFIGLVQALIFAVLTLVFAVMATTSHDEH